MARVVEVPPGWGLLIADAGDLVDINHIADKQFRMVRGTTYKVVSVDYDRWLVTLEKTHGNS